MNVNAKLQERYVKGIKKYRPILTKAQASDINESDTVTIVTDILCDIMGYDKYDHITSEYSIKKTYCDIAIKIEGNVKLLIECKAVGVDLKDDHMRQATNYAADLGVEWAVLTNGIDWKIYKIIFSQPIERKLVYEFNMLDISAKKAEVAEYLYYLSAEAFQKGSKQTLDDYYNNKLIANRYTLGLLLYSDSVIDYLRRQFRKLFPEISIDSELIKKIITSEVVRREIIESDEASLARKTIARAQKKLNLNNKKTDN